MKRLTMVLAMMAIAATGCDELVLEPVLNGIYPPHPDPTPRTPTRPREPTFPQGRAPSR